MSFSKGQKSGQDDQRRVIFVFGERHFSLWFSFVFCCGVIVFSRGSFSVLGQEFVLLCDLHGS